MKIPGDSEVLFLELAIWKPFGHDEWRVSVTDEGCKELINYPVPLSLGIGCLLDGISEPVKTAVEEFDFRSKRS